MDFFDRAAIVWEPQMEGNCCWSDLPNKYVTPSDFSGVFLVAYTKAMLILKSPPSKISELLQEGGQLLT